jgi:hypothetical protein
MLSRMEEQPQNFGWRSRKVWLGGLVALGLAVAAGWLGSGGCVSIAYSPDVVLPESFPWRLAAYLGGAAAMRVVAVADVVGPVAGWLSTSLLIGALWARVLRRSWAVWALVLVPSLVAAMHLLRAGLLQTYSSPPPGLPEWLFVVAWIDFQKARYFASGVLFTLIGVGALLVLGQMTWMRRMRARGAAVKDVD